MSDVAQFAYMQARVQARHGMRPDALVWRRLQGTASLGSYLQAAQGTTLSPWVAGLLTSHSSHQIEQALRGQFRNYIDQVAHWLPPRWSGYIHWISQLPDLPAVQHLLGGEAAPAWMLEDARLRRFASENVSVRNEALLDSVWRYQVLARQRGVPPGDAWFENWQHQWPGPVRLHAGMTRLATLLQAHLNALRTNHHHVAAEQRVTLLHQLQAVFRRYSFQPAAACAHLALVALDLETLRADLVSRVLFPDAAEVDA